MTTPVTTSQPTTSTQTSAVTVPTQCYNCRTAATPLWRKDDKGKTVCNTYVSSFPLSARKYLTLPSIPRRANGVEETPSASPGASRRTSPVTDGISNRQPTPSPDSTTQMSYAYDEAGTSGSFGRRSPVLPKQLLIRWVQHIPWSLSP